MLFRLTEYYYIDQRVFSFLSVFSPHRVFIDRNVLASPVHSFFDEDLSSQVQAIRGGPCTYLLFIPDHCSGEFL